VVGSVTLNLLTKLLEIGPPRKLIFGGPTNTLRGSSLPLSVPSVRG